MVWIGWGVIGTFLLFIGLKLENIDHNLKWFRDRQQVRDNNPLVRE